MMPESRVAAPLDRSQAVAIGQELYGLDASVQPLPGEYDDNFHLSTEDQREFVLKVMHPAREASFVDMQCRALNHLAERAPHLRLPRVVPTLQGELFHQGTMPDRTQRLVWLLTFLPGGALADAKPRDRELLTSLGKLLAEIDTALLDFSHPAAKRELKWDSTRALWARGYLSYVKDPERRELAEKFLRLFETEVLPRLPALRRSVIYGDANDHNVLVSAAWPQPRQSISVIDFGDLHESITVAEPAIASAYALLGQGKPLETAAALLGAFHQALPLSEEEVAAFFPLVAARLAVSVVNSAHRQSLVPDDPYVTVTEAPAWEALQRLAKINPGFAQYTFRAACGWDVAPQAAKIERWLRENGSRAASVIPQDLTDDAVFVLDLSVASQTLPADPAHLTEPLLTRKLHTILQQAKATVGVGRYDEARSLYMSPLFGDESDPTAERRTVHLGIDLFVEPGTPGYRAV